MDDVVGVTFSHGAGDNRALITWGRVYDTVDPSKLVEKLEALLPRMGFAAPTKIRVHETLRGVQRYEYFYEGLISFSSRIARQENSAKAFKAIRKDDSRFRKSIFLLGSLQADEGHLGASRITS